MVQSPTETFGVEPKQRKRASFRLSLPLGYSILFSITFILVALAFWAGMSISRSGGPVSLFQGRGSFPSPMKSIASLSFSEVPVLPK